MLHKLRLGLLAASVTASWIVASAAAACVLAPPASSEETAARVLRFQDEQWTRAQNVYLAQTTSEGRSMAEDGALRVWTELTPVLQLKGHPVTAPQRVQQTGMSSCGPLPDLQVLLEKSGGYYIVYSSSPTATPDSIRATVPVRKLVEPHAIAAWRAAAAGAPRE
jgi:hypothetical protein